MAAPASASRLGGWRIQRLLAERSRSRDTIAAARLAHSMLVTFVALHPACSGRQR